MRGREINENMQKILFSKDLIPILTRGETLLNRADIMVFAAATTDDILKIHIEETLNIIVTMLDLPGTRSESVYDIIWQSQSLKEVFVVMICEEKSPTRRVANGAGPMPSWLCLWILTCSRKTCGNS